MIRISSLILALGLSLASGAAMAMEIPSEAQKEALRTDCRADFIKHCKGVSPGGLPAFQCLAKNYGELSSACEAAVKSVDPDV